MTDGAETKRDEHDKGVVDPTKDWSRITSGPRWKKVTNDHIKKLKERCSDDPEHLLGDLDNDPKLDALALESRLWNHLTPTLERAVPDGLSATPTLVNKERIKLGRKVAVAYVKAKTSYTMLQEAKEEHASVKAIEGENKKTAKAQVAKLKASIMTCKGEQTKCATKVKQCQVTLAAAKKTVDDAQKSADAEQQSTEQESTGAQPGIQIEIVDMTVMTPESAARATRERNRADVTPALVQEESRQASASTDESLEDQLQSAKEDLENIKNEIATAKRNPDEAQQDDAQNPLNGLEEKQVDAENPLKQLQAQLKQAQGKVDQLTFKVAGKDLDDAAVESVIGKDQLTALQAKLKAQQGIVKGAAANIAAAETNEKAMEAMHNHYDEGYQTAQGNLESLAFEKSGIPPSYLGYSDDDPAFNEALEQALTNPDGTKGTVDDCFNRMCSELGEKDPLVQLATQALEFIDQTNNDKNQKFKECKGKNDPRKCGMEKHDLKQKFVRLQVAKKMLKDCTCTERCSRVNPLAAKTDLDKAEDRVAEAENALVKRCLASMPEDKKDMTPLQGNLLALILAVAECMSLTGHLRKRIDKMHKNYSAKKDLLAQVKNAPGLRSAPGQLGGTAGSTGPGSDAAPPSVTPFLPAAVSAANDSAPGWVHAANRDLVANDGNGAALTRSDPVSSSEERAAASARSEQLASAAESRQPQQQHMH